MPTIRGLQYLSFIFLAVSVFPLSTFLLVFNYIFISLVSRDSIRQHLVRTPGFISRTILLTGAHTPQGLHLARAFHETGHKVVGADYEPRRLPIPARFSRVLSRFYRLEAQPEDSNGVKYTAALIRIITREQVDAWINCDGSVDPMVDAQARETIEQNTDCHCFGLRTADATYFATRDAFLMYTKSLGLPVPESYLVGSRDEIHKVLSKAHRRRRYLLQSLHLEGLAAESNRTMLPGRTLSQTYNTVARMPIQKTKPWRLEQVTEGLRRFSTFAIIVDRTLMAFAASCSTNVDGEQVLLDHKSALNQSMLRYVQTFASKQSPDLNTHLGIDFCVEEHVNETGALESIFPVAVSVQAQGGALFFQGIAGSVQLTRAYLACLTSRIEEDTNDQRLRSTSRIAERNSDQAVAVPSPVTPGIYYFGQDLLQLCLMPLIRLVTFDISPTECFSRVVLFLRHVVFWREGEYSFHDPVPFWWFYQVYIPLRLAMTMYGEFRGFSESWSENAAPQSHMLKLEYDNSQRRTNAKKSPGRLPNGEISSNKIGEKLAQARLGD